MRKSIIIRSGMIVLTVGILYLLTGCGNKPSNEDFIFNGIKLYEQYFNDTFVLINEVRGGSGTWGEFGTLEEGKKEVLVTSKNYPNKEISMSFFYNRNTKKYRLGMTNYNFIRYEDQLIKDLEKVTQLFSDCVIHIEALAEPAINCNYDDYVSTSNNNVSMTLYIAPLSQYNEKDAIEKIRNTLKENKLNIRNVIIYYLKNNEEYINIKNNIDYKMNKNSYDLISFYLDENYQIKNIFE